MLFRPRRFSAAAPTTTGPIATGAVSSGVLDVGVDHVGDHHGDVVGAARVERLADQLDRGVLDGALAEDRADLLVVEGGVDAVGAEQHPVAEREVDVELVGLGLVDAVDRAQDQAAVRVDPGLLLGDPALVDQALHERVVAW